MIDVTESTPSQNVTEKSRQCFVRRLAVDKYVVTPRPFAKSRRLVTFILRRGNRLLAKCENLYTGESCPANLHHLHCYHVTAAIRRAEINARRQSGSNSAERNQ